MKSKMMLYNKISWIYIAVFFPLNLVFPTQYRSLCWPPTWAKQRAQRQNWGWPSKSMTKTPLVTSLIITMIVFNVSFMNLKKWGWPSDNDSSCTLSVYGWSYCIAIWLAQICCELTQLSLAFCQTSKNRNDIQGW